MEDIFTKYNREHHDGSHLTGVIVYKKENFQEDYSLKSRSYRVRSDCKAFLNTIGRSLWGESLDGSDPNVRLDLYNWKIDYCYLETVGKEEKDKSKKGEYVIYLDGYEWSRCKTKEEADAKVEMYDGDKDCYWEFEEFEEEDE